MDISDIPKYFIASFVKTLNGFKDGRTAELMMQRAKKLKYNALKKKKLSRLGEKQFDFNN